MVRRPIREAHRRSLRQVVAICLGGSWVLPEMEARAGRLEPTGFPGQR